MIRHFREVSQWESLPTIYTGFEYPLILYVMPLVCKIGKNRKVIRKLVLADIVLQCQGLCLSPSPLKMDCREMAQVPLVFTLTYLKLSPFGDV